MWSEALSMLDRAERLQRQSFHHTAASREPPADITEGAEHVEVQVALPGVAAAQEAERSERKIGFLLQKDPQKNEVKPDDLHWVGTAGQVVRYITGGEGAHHMVVQGGSRFRALEFLEGWPFLVARVQMIESPADQEGKLAPAVEARFLQLKAQAIEAIQLLPNAPEEL